MNVMDCVVCHVAQEAKSNEAVSTDAATVLRDLLVVIFILDPTSGGTCGFAAAANP